MIDEPLKFDLLRLTRESRAFATRLFANLPVLQCHAVMEPKRDSDQFNLALETPSPSGDPERRMIIWMDSGTDPSVSFGHWHGHVRIDRDPDGAMDSIIDTIAGILADQRVLIYDDGLYEGYCELIDIRDRMALADELTSKFSSGRVRVVSWTGAVDRVVGLYDLSLD